MFSRWIPSERAPNETEQRPYLGRERSDKAMRQLASMCALSAQCGFWPNVFAKPRDELLDDPPFGGASCH